MKTTLCLLTLNAAAGSQLFLDALGAQTLRDPDLLVIDSGSGDCTTDVFRKAGFRIHNIPRHSFDHGATRQLAVSLCPGAEVVIFMTQDAVLAHPRALEELLAPFSDPLVGAAYGRQLPRPGAGPVEAHARLFNYPDKSRVKSTQDIPSLGLKTAFISNSFAAYRLDVLKEVGGFPEKTIIGEDTYVAGKMLLAGLKIVYCAEAQVFHSHDYSFWQELQRYFDTGVFHARNPWMKEAFGGAEGEGWRFLKSEFCYIARHQPWLIHVGLTRTFLRYTGFRLGLLEKYFALPFKQRISAQKSFWEQEV